MRQGETALLLHSHHPPPPPTQLHTTPFAHPVYYRHYLVTRLNCLQSLLPALGSTFWDRYHKEAPTKIMLCIWRKRQSYTFTFTSQGKGTGPFKWTFVRSLVGWAAKGLGFPCWRPLSILAQGARTAQPQRLPIPSGNSPTQRQGHGCCPQG